VKGDLSRGGGGWNSGVKVQGREETRGGGGGQGGIGPGGKSVSSGAHDERGNSYPRGGEKKRRKDKAGKSQALRKKTKN